MHKAQCYQTFVRYHRECHFCQRIRENAVVLALVVVVYFNFSASDLPFFILFYRNRMMLR